MALTEQQQADMLRQEMDRQHVTDNQLRAGIAAIAMGESGFQMKPELGYANTSDDRIRMIFGSRIAVLSNDELDRLKASDQDFFNFVYGGSWGKIKLGNTEPGDGYKFRGRGAFQITGRANYQRYGNMVGRPDILDNPDIADDPAVACAMAVAYMRYNYKGGGWEEMKRVVGNNIADIEATKNQLFEQYLQSGEFDPIPGSVAAGGSDQPSDPATGLQSAVDRAKAIQKILAAGGNYTGAIDGELGTRSWNAFQELGEQAKTELANGHP